MLLIQCQRNIILVMSVELIMKSNFDFTENSQFASHLIARRGEIKFQLQILDAEGIMTDVPFEGKNQRPLDKP